MKAFRFGSVIGLILASFFPGLTYAQTTYTWPGDGGSHLDMSYNINTAMRITLPAKVTEVQINSSTDTDPGGFVIANVTVSSGPNPQVGEYIDAAQGAPGAKGLFELLAVTANSDGSFTITESARADWGFPPQSGTAFIGPGLGLNLYFTGSNFLFAKCNPSASTVSAGYLDASGNLQSAVSQAGTITCSNSSVLAGNQYVTTTSGSFQSSVGVVNFTIVNESGRYGQYAQSAQWDPFLTGGGTGGGGKASAKPFYPCGSKHLPCEGF